MDFLNQSIAQIRELFASMTPGARITSVLLLVAVVVSLAYLVQYGITGGGTYLLGGEAFSQHDLQTMEVAFGKKGLKDFSVEGNRIRVPRAQQSSYLAALADENALPHSFGDYMERAINSSSPFRPKDVQESAMKVAELKELSQILSLMEGIDWVRVMCKSQDKGGLNRQRTTTASVNVMPKHGPLDDALMRSLRVNVSTSLNIDAKDITVTDVSTGRTTRGDPESGGAEDPVIAARQSYQNDYCKQIREALSYVPGVTVTCNVQMDREKSRQEEQVTYDPKSVSYQVTDNNRKRTHEGSSPGGKVGYQAQAANQRMTLDNSAKGSREEEEQEERKEMSVIGGTRKQITSLGLQPRVVTASIGVPTSYFAKVWEKRNPPEAGKPAKTPTAADLQRIQGDVQGDIKACVGKLLPSPTDIADPGRFDPKQLVEVTVFEDLKPTDVTGPSVTEEVVNWLQQSWTTLGLLALGFVSLAMLRSMTRYTPPAAIAATEEAAGEEKEAEAGAGQQEHVEMPKPVRKFQGTGQSLHDELSELVRDDPDAAVNILRNWIGNVN
jgi:flagellar M-ring protein FliF